MTQEPVSSCLIVTTYKQQVNKLKLVEAASQFCFKNEHLFNERINTFPESLPKVLLRRPKHRTKGLVQ